MVNHESQRFCMIVGKPYLIRSISGLPVIPLKSRAPTNASSDFLVSMGCFPGRDSHLFDGLSSAIEH